MVPRLQYSITVICYTNNLGKQAGAELSQAQQQPGSCPILLFYAVVMYGDEAVSKKCFEVYSQPLTT